MSSKRALKIIPNLCTMCREIVNQIGEWGKIIVRYPEFKIYLLHMQYFSESTKEFPHKKGGMSQEKRVYRTQETENSQETQMEC